MTANPARHKLQDTPGEAVALSLLTRSGWSVENFPLHEVKVPVHPSLYLEINALSLAQPRHVDPGPELSSLLVINHPAVPVRYQPVHSLLPPGAVQSAGQVVPRVRTAETKYFQISLATVTFQGET